MNARSPARSLSPALAAAPGQARSGAARALIASLAALRHGRLRLRLPDGEALDFGRAEPRQELLLRDWGVFDAVAARGDIGFGEAFVRGDWDTPDLAGLLGLLAANREPLARAVHGRRPALLAARIGHFLNANTRSGSRRNIVAHYDLGNDFYALWLDAGMSYSSALFGDQAGGDLEAAQQAKYRRILARLGVVPGEAVLEIGCGWGGFAEIAAREAAARVLGVTLSPAQLDYARRRAERAGLAERMSFELCDYRDLRGQYRHIVSIEMFEAVGERFWPAYFERLRALLAPGGRALVQTITIADALFARYRRGTDFIQRHVFPGGMLPSPAAFTAAARRAGLAVVGDFAFGGDYARTLAHWQRRFAARGAERAALGFDGRFERLWRFYLAYSEAGFASGSTDVHQFELVRAA